MNKETAVKHDVISRVETVREQMHLNKSRFSAEINMKPQTYNNFIGAQGSKPSIELVTGVIDRFGVNPMWLLKGIGSMFLDGTSAPVKVPTAVMEDIHEKLKRLDEKLHIVAEHVHCPLDDQEASV